jgi:hypothetical protein
VRYPYNSGDTKITAPGTTLTPLPSGPIDHHWTKSLVANADGSLLYVGVGSNSNITENGMEADENRAANWEMDRATGRWRIFRAGRSARSWWRRVDRTGRPSRPSAPRPVRGEVLPSPQLGVLLPLRSNCSFYFSWRDQLELPTVRQARRQQMSQTCVSNMRC